MNITRHVFAFATLAFLVAGCNGTTVNSTGGPSAGSIAGIVKIYDTASIGSTLMPSFAGVTVALGGTAYQAVTDSNGHWRLDNVPPGNYDVSISESGFGYWKLFGRAVAGPGVAYVGVANLGREPSETVTIDSIHVVPDTGTGTNPMFRIMGHISSSFAMSLFLDLDSNEFSDAGHFSRYSVMPVLNSWSVSIPRSSLSSLKLTSGSHVYFTAAAYNSAAGSFTDFPSGFARFVSTGKRSNLVSFIVP